MITTSEAWKSAYQEAVVPETFVEITYDVTEPGLQDEAKPSNNGEMSFARSGDIIDMDEKNPPLYATLERSIWGLDGTFDVLPDQAPYGDTGYVSDVFVDSGTMPVVSISFGAVHTQLIPGITITWSSAYGEYATRFRVSAFNSGTFIDSQDFENDSITSLCEMPLSGYDELRIEVLEWCLPNRRARIESVFVGVRKTYTKSDLLSYSHSQTGDLLSAALPKNSIKFSIDNVDGMWNPDNLMGYVQFLAERQQITVRYGMKLDNGIEWVKAGTFWLNEWDTPSNGLEVSFTARDIIEFMSDTYNGTRKGTLYAIVTAALRQADLPTMADDSLRYVVSDVLKNRTVDFTDDESELTIAEVIQLCANAACCVIYQDRNGVLHIEPLNTAVTDYEISQYNSYAHPEYTFSKPLKSVSVNNDLGTAENATAGEVQKVSNALITDATHATTVAQHIRDTLKERRTITGEYRADPTLDVFDTISVASKYGDKRVIVTDIEYSYSGAFRGKYTGRMTEV